MRRAHSGETSMTKPKRELLRDDVNGKVAGVCAGIADTLVGKPGWYG